MFCYYTFLFLLRNEKVDHALFNVQIHSSEKFVYLIFTLYITPVVIEKGEKKKEYNSSQRRILFFSSLKIAKYNPVILLYYKKNTR